MTDKPSAELSFRAATHVEVPFTGVSRSPFQAAHQQYIAALLHDGSLLAAGALGDGSGSILLVVGAPQVAQILVEADPYWAAGVWGEPSLREFLYASLPNP